MTDITEERLKPCFRCGTHAEVVVANHIRCANIYNCDNETRLGAVAWNRRASDGREAEVNFVTALDVAEKVFDQYKTDQLRWWKRMDGTPILNDVACRMAEAFRDYAKAAIEAHATHMKAFLEELAPYLGVDGEGDFKPRDLIDAAAKIRENWDARPAALHHGASDGLGNDSDWLRSLRATIESACQIFDGWKNVDPNCWTDFDARVRTGLSAHLTKIDAALCHSASDGREAKLVAILQRWRKGAAVLNDDYSLLSDTDAALHPSTEGKRETCDRECTWIEIEDDSGVYNTCKPGEEFHLTEGMELWPYCHLCGGKIAVAGSDTHHPGCDVYDVTRPEFGDCSCGFDDCNGTGKPQPPEVHEWTDASGAVVREVFDGKPQQPVCEKCNGERRIPDIVMRDWGIGYENVGWKPCPRCKHQQPSQPSRSPTGREACAGFLLSQCSEEKPPHAPRAGHAKVEISVDQAREIAGYLQPSQPVIPDDPVRHGSEYDSVVQPSDSAEVVRHFSDIELLQWLHDARVDHGTTYTSTMRDGHSKHHELLRIVRAAILSRPAPTDAETSEVVRMLKELHHGSHHALDKPGMYEAIRCAISRLSRSAPRFSEEEREVGICGSMGPVVLAGGKPIGLCTLKSGHSGWHGDGNCNWSNEPHVALAEQPDAREKGQ